MDNKEKLEEAKRLYETANPDQRYVLEKFFPELKESEDEKIRESLLEYLHTLPNHYAHSGVCAPEWIDWLEKQGEQKPAWSEEGKKLWVHDDDIFLDAAKMIVEDSPRKSYGGVHKKEIVPWFYSLKERLKSLRPQNTWKPSDEQMKLLKEVSYRGWVLYTLYQDLKKL